MIQFSLKHYRLLFYRYWVTLLLAAVLAGAATYILQKSQPPEYISATKIYIGTALASVTSDPIAIVSAAELTDIYAEYVRNDVLLAQAIRDLNLPDKLEDMRWRITTETISGHPFLYVRAVYPDPQIAADLANAVVQNMIDTVNANQTGDVESQLESLQAKIENLNTLIDLTNQEYQEAYDTLEAARRSGDATPEQISAQTANIDRLSEQLNESYGALARFTREYVLLYDISNQLEVVEVARPNPNTVSRNPLFFTLIAGVTALVFSASVIVLLDYFDDHIRTEEEVRHQFAVPFLGGVPRVRWSHKRYQRFVRTGRLLNRPIVGDYRLILNGLLADLESSPGRPTSTQDDDLPLFMVTSPVGQTGSSFTANNLAIVASEYGLKTLLVDMSWREPDLHTYFDVDNDYGVAELVEVLASDPALLQDSVRRRVLKSWPLHANPIYPNLSLLCSGQNAKGLVGQLPQLRLLRDYFTVMVRHLGYDLVIMSGAALDQTSDSHNIIAQTNAAVLLVISSSNTRIDPISEALEQFKRRKADVCGIIMNDVF